MLHLLLLCYLTALRNVKLTRVMQHTPRPHKRQPNHKDSFVSWKGMGPEERAGPEECAWLSEHKLKNAADVVQEY